MNKVICFDGLFNVFFIKENVFAIETNNNNNVHSSNGMVHAVASDNELIFVVESTVC